MTARERVLAALQHKQTDKVPFSLGFGINDYAKKELAEYLKLSAEELEKLLARVSDVRHVAPRYIGPQDRRVVRDGREIDEWGVWRKKVYNGYDTYKEIEIYPLKGLSSMQELEEYRFPSPDWFDYSVLPAEIEAACGEEEHAVILAAGNLFETSWYLAGFEDMLALLLLDPELAGALMEKVTDFFIGYTERALTAAGGRIDIAFTADDIGQQDGLLMSLPVWKEVIQPQHKRLNKKLHEMGVKVMYHTDGAIMDAVDGLVEMGVDILEALQFDARGMDSRKLKENWGDRLCFHGGVSVQSTLPFGTPEDVRREVEERVRVLGRNGGYILAPSHAIQGGTPPENIVAFLEAAQRI